MLTPVELPVEHETAAEDIRNALTLLDAAAIVFPGFHGAPVTAEIRARLLSALGKIETAPAGHSGAARGIVAAHPGVPASLYMVSL